MHFFLRYWKKKLNGCTLCRKANKKPWILWSLSFRFVITVYYCVTNVQNVWDSFSFARSASWSSLAGCICCYFELVSVCREVLTGSDQKGLKLPSEYFDALNFRYLQITCWWKHWLVGLGGPSPHCQKAVTLAKPPLVITFLCFDGNDYCSPVCYTQADSGSTRTTKTQILTTVETFCLFSFFVKKRSPWISDHFFCRHQHTTRMILYCLALSSINCCC